MSTYYVNRSQVIVQVSSSVYFSNLIAPGGYMLKNSNKTRRDAGWEKNTREKHAPKENIHMCIDVIQAK